MRNRTQRNQKCRDIFSALSEYLDGTLPARNCRELRDHLKGCKPCLEYLETLKNTIAACHVYAVAVTPPPPSAAVLKAFQRALCKRGTRHARPVDLRGRQPRRIGSGGHPF